MHLKWKVLSNQKSKNTNASSFKNIKKNSHAESSTFSSVLVTLLGNSSLQFGTEGFICPIQRYQGSNIGLFGHDTDALTLNLFLCIILVSNEITKQNHSDPVMGHYGFFFLFVLHDKELQLITSCINKFLHYHIGKSAKELRQHGIVQGFLLDKLGSYRKRERTGHQNQKSLFAFLFPGKQQPFAYN